MASSSSWFSINGTGTGVGGHRGNLSMQIILDVCPISNHPRHDASDKRRRNTRWKHGQKTLLWVGHEQKRRSPRYTKKEQKGVSEDGEDGFSLPHREIEYFKFSINKIAFGRFPSCVVCVWIYDKIFQPSEMCFMGGKKNTSPHWERCKSGKEWRISAWVKFFPGPKEVHTWL